MLLEMVACAAPRPLRKYGTLAKKTCQIVTKTPPVADSRHHEAPAASKESMDMEIDTELDMPLSRLPARAKTPVLYSADAQAHTNNPDHVGSEPQELGGGKAQAQDLGGGEMGHEQNVLSARMPPAHATSPVAGSEGLEEESASDSVCVRVRQKQPASGMRSSTATHHELEFAGSAHAQQAATMDVTARDDSVRTAVYTDNGHAWIGKRVRRTIWGLVGTTHQITATADGHIAGWLPVGESDFVDARGNSAALWKIEYDDTGLGEEDLEEHEVTESLSLFASHFQVPAAACRKGGSKRAGSAPKVPPRSCRQGPATVKIDADGLRLLVLRILTNHQLSHTHTTHTLALPFSTAAVGAEGTCSAGDGAQSDDRKRGEGEDGADNSKNERQELPEWLLPSWLLDHDADRHELDWDGYLSDEGQEALDSRQRGAQDRTARSVLRLLRCNAQQPSTPVHGNSKTARQAKARHSLRAWAKSKRCKRIVWGDGRRHSMEEDDSSTHFSANADSQLGATHSNTLQHAATDQRAALAAESAQLEPASVQLPEPPHSLVLPQPMVLQGSPVCAPQNEPPTGADVSRGESRRGGSSVQTSALCACKSGKLFSECHAPLLKSLRPQTTAATTPSASSSAIVTPEVSRVQHGSVRALGVAKPKTNSSPNKTGSLRLAQPVAAAAVAKQALPHAPQATVRVVRTFPECVVPLTQEERDVVEASRLAAQANTAIAYAGTREVEMSSRIPHVPSTRTAHALPDGGTVTVPFHPTAPPRKQLASNTHPSVASKTQPPHMHMREPWAVQASAFKTVHAGTVPSNAHTQPRAAATNEGEDVRNRQTGQGRDTGGGADRVYTTLRQRGGTNAHVGNAGNIRSMSSSDSDEDSDEDVPLSHKLPQPHAQSVAYASKSHVNTPQVKSRACAVNTTHDNDAHTAARHVSSTPSRHTSSTPPRTVPRASHGKGPQSINSVSHNPPPFSSPFSSAPTSAPTRAHTSLGSSSARPAAASLTAHAHVPGMRSTQHATSILASAAGSAASHTKCAAPHTASLVPSKKRARESESVQPPPSTPTTQTQLQQQQQHAELQVETLQIQLARRCTRHNNCTANFGDFFAPS